jgi:auxin responsive GH3 family protein
LDLDKGKTMNLYHIKGSRPVFTSYCQARVGTSWERPHNPVHGAHNPDETILCVDAYQNMYVQLHCGLVHRAYLLRVGAIFPSGFLKKPSGTYRGMHQTTIQEHRRNA